MARSGVAGTAYVVGQVRRKSRPVVLAGVRPRTDGGTGRPAAGRGGVALANSCSGAGQATGHGQ